MSDESGSPRAVSLSRRAWNLASSLAAFAADGGRMVSKEQYAQRLAICDDCHRRQDSRCGACGCYLPVKAKGRAMKCPLDKWPPA